MSADTILSAYASNGGDGRAESGVDGCLPYRAGERGEVDGGGDRAGGVVKRDCRKRLS